MSWLKARLKERDTYLGIITLLASFGIALNPEYQEAVISIGIALGGLVAVIWPDAPPEA